MIIDQRVCPASIRQFASQITEISPEMASRIRKLLKGNQPAEFYAGLLAGLSAAYQANGVGQAKLIGPMLAVVADMCEQREFVV